MMPEYLEYSLDKFTFRIATGRYYSREGVWAREEDGRITMGLSDYLQQSSGDIAFAEILAPGTKVSFGEEVAQIETIKVDMSLPSPTAGIIVEVNPAMEMTPECINQDPYGEGWLAIIEASDWPADQAQLLDSQAYYKLMVAELEEEAAS